MTSHHTRIFHCNDMKGELRGFHNKTNWVNFAWIQDWKVLLKLDSISWPKTLKNNSFRGLVVNTLFQEVNGSSQPKGCIQGSTKIGPVLEVTTSCLYGKTELKSECGLWVKTILILGSEFLMDQTNSWLIRTTTTEVPEDQPEEQALQLNVNDFAHRSKAKAKPQEGNLLIHQASFRWMKESGLILNQEECFLSLCVRDFEESNPSASTLSNSTTRRRRSSSILDNWELSSESMSTDTLLVWWSLERLWPTLSKPTSGHPYFTTLAKPTSGQKNLTDFVPTLIDRLLAKPVLTFSNWPILATFCVLECWPTLAKPTGQLFHRLWPISVF